MAAQGKAKIKYVTGCVIHGSEVKKGGHKHEVKVSQPKTKKQRLHGGCPLCKKEQ